MDKLRSNLSIQVIKIWPAHFATLLFADNGEVEVGSHLQYIALTQIYGEVFEDFSFLI